MGQRKLFLLFLSSMAVSIIIMVIIYGVFIKDIDFSFDVKNPESAPSPIDDTARRDTNEIPVEADESSPAEVTTPEEAAKSKPGDDMDDSTVNGEADKELLDDPITDVVPLEPVSPQTDSVLPAHPSSSSSSAPVESLAATPTLHFVYMDGFSTRDAAEAAIAQLQDRKLSAQPYIRQHHGRIILQFGVFSDRENADAMARSLRQNSVFVKVE
jgi:hypothetical protein